MKEIAILFGGTTDFEFGMYSLGGDVIASAFGNSRNKHFGSLLGQGMTAEEALNQLTIEKKHAE